MTLPNDAGALRDALKALQRDLKAQEKALDDLAKGDADGDVPTLHAALAALDVDVLARVGQGETTEGVRAAARERLQALRQEQRRALANELQAAAADAGRTFRRLGENPPEFLFTPFTVTVDLDRMEAALAYAREELARVPAKAPEIAKAAEKAEKELAAKQLAPEEEFDLLWAAYRAAAAAEGRTAGERVELAPVLAQVALLRQGKRFEEDPLKERFASYPKARFLFDVTRLRNARLLERNGLRLDLGTATGDSTKKKGRVFWLPNPDGTGQYYLTIRFVRVG